MNTSSRHAIPWRDLQQYKIDQMTTDNKAVIALNNHGDMMSIGKDGVESR